MLMHWVKDGKEIQRCGFSATNIGEVATDALAETLKENLTTVSNDSLMSEYPTRQGSINCTKILYDH